MTKSRDLGNLAQSVAVNLPASLGSASQTLAVNSGASALEFVDAATGGGGGSLQAVASGSLSDGSTVIINSDGTVSAVAGSSSFTIGSQVQWETSTQNAHTAIAYDQGADKIVVTYKDVNNSNYLQVVVGSVSGTSISFGTPLVYFSGASTSKNKPRILYHPGNQKVFIFGGIYTNAQSRLWMLTVSGTSITLDSTTSPFSGANMWEYGFDMCYDAASGNLVLLANPSWMELQVVTVSGSSLSLGSRITFPGTQSFSTDYAVIESDGNGGIFLVYNNYSNTRVYSATLSGSSLTFHSNIMPQNQFNYKFTGMPSLIYLPSVSRFLLVGPRPSAIEAFLYSVSTSGSVGFTNTAGPTTFSTGTYSSYQGNNVDAVYYTPISNPYIAYSHNPSSTLKLNKLTCTATAITFGTEVDVGTSSANTSLFFPYMAYDPDTQSIVLVAHDDFGTGAQAAFAHVINPQTQSTNLTANNFLGISDGVYSNGQTATIQTIGSVDDAQSGLVPPNKYYVQYDGSLSTTAGNPSVEAGMAVASTKIIVKG